MEGVLLLGAFAGGAAFGVIVTFLALRQSDEKRKAGEALLIENLKTNFRALSIGVLNKSNDNFLKLAQERLKTQTTQHSEVLEGQKHLIDKQLESMTSQLNKVSTLVEEFEEKRAEKLGALGNELERLTRTSDMLQKALADNRSRGQWGERIADDILRLAGFIEGVNYSKQITIDSDEARKSRPDFTFMLPNSMCLNMDSKFPLDNYLRYLESEATTDREEYRKKFLFDVRKRVKEVKDRGYVSVENNTVDCVLMFIPNEQIYRFIHEEDASIIDEALQEKVIICSPLTLYVVLAVIRQAVDNFKLEQSSKDVLILLSEFRKQWEAYVKKMDDIGHSLDKAREAYDDLRGKRRKALDKPMSQIDGLLAQNAIIDETMPQITSEGHSNVWSPGEQDSALLSSTENPT